MNNNSNLLLSAAPVALLPLPPGAAALTIGAVAAPAFADTLAAQQAGAALEQLAMPPAADAPGQEPGLAMAELASAATLALPVGEAQDPAEPASEASPNPVDGQTSYALAALGLWQTVPLPAVEQASRPMGAAVALPATPLDLASAPAAVPAAAPAAAPIGATAVSAQPAPLQQRSTDMLDMARQMPATPVALPFSAAAELHKLVAKPQTDTAIPLPQAGSLVTPEPQASAADLGLALPGLALESLKAASPLAAPVADATVMLKGEPRQWQQPLLQALGDRLQVQIAGRSEQAVIRLEPPLLGQVEIAIRQQAGELQVRINASHGEVARQLQHVSDHLRQDLVQRHSGEVTVQVTQGARADDGRQTGRDPQSQQQQQQQAQEQREQQRRPGRALGGNGESGDSGAAGFAPALTSADLTA